MLPLFTNVVVHLPPLDDKVKSGGACDMAGTVYVISLVADFVPLLQFAVALNITLDACIGNVVVYGADKVCVFCAPPFTA